MTTPNQILDEVVSSITPLFATSGYKKSARAFVALEGGVARVVQLQTSQLKKPEEAKFTLNLLVASVAFQEAYAGKPFPKNPASAEAVVQAPIASEAALLRELESGAVLPGFGAMRERCRAVLLAKGGRKAEAGKALAALIEANSADGLQGFRDSVVELGQRLGVSVL